MLKYFIPVMPGTAAGAEIYLIGTTAAGLIALAAAAAIIAAFFAGWYIGRRDGIKAGKVEAAIETINHHEGGGAHEA